VALERGVSPEDEAGVTRLAEAVTLDVRRPTVQDGRDVTILADGRDITWDIRSPDVELAVSPVATYRGVRQALSRQQRRIGLAGKVVMVGRDIGTVVLPEADLKIYLDAEVKERARRRFGERRARGEEATFDGVLAELQRRDRIDSTRVHSPLMVATDAIIVDSTRLSIDDVMRRVMGLLDRWRAGQKAK
jgi:cytidylate kinase